MRKLSMNELGRKSVEEFKLSSKIPVIAVLENVRSAYNVGSVFRTADAFLIEAIYLTGYTAKPPHKEIKKTALGAEETVHWKHFPVASQAIQELHQNGYKVFAVEQVEHSVTLAKFEGTGSIAVIFGNEVKGVQQKVVTASDAVIEIPQFGTKHSLNISVSVGVVVQTRLELMAAPKAGPVASTGGV